jgi:hypothetical protein
VPVCSAAACVRACLTVPQATVGDVEGSQPWAVQMEARAKWDAWNSVKGMSKEDAMSQYIAIVTKGDANWRVSCCCHPPTPSILLFLRGMDVTLMTGFSYVQLTLWRPRSFPASSVVAACGNSKVHMISAFILFCFLLSKKLMSPSEG